MKRIFFILFLVLAICSNSHSFNVRYSAGTGGGGTGNVTGPESSTDNAIVRYDGATGKIIQDTSSTSIDDSGKITQTATLNAATGNEVAHTLNYTTNKATSGNDTGLLISQTDTLSPGVSIGLQCMHGANTVLAVDMGNERVGIGTVAPVAKFHISDGTALAAGISASDTFVNSNSNTTSGGMTTIMANSNDARPLFQAIRAQGNISSPTAVISGNRLLGVLAGGYDGNAVQYPASVEYLVDGTVSSGHVPARISFVTGTTGSDRTERLTIKNDGKIGIGTTSPDRQFHDEVASALTNTIQQVARFSHITSGTPANGIGLGLEFEQETTDNNNEIIATIEAVVTDVTATSEDADLVFKTMAAGAAANEKLRITSIGAIVVPTTIVTPGTTGNVTINKLAGRVNIAAAGTTITVTNSLVTANSIIVATAATNDATGVVKNVVAAAGSFVINVVGVTAETAFNWIVISQ